MSEFTNLMSKTHASGQNALLCLLFFTWVRLEPDIWRNHSDKVKGTTNHHCRRSWGAKKRSCGKLGFSFPGTILILFLLPSTVPENFLFLSLTRWCCRTGGYVNPGKCDPKTQNLLSWAASMFGVSVSEKSKSSRRLGKWRSDLGGTVFPFSLSFDGRKFTMVALSILPLLLAFIGKEDSKQRRKLFSKLFFS